jgi:hypothetical protein
MKRLPLLTPLLALALMVNVDVRAQDSGHPPPEMKVLRKLAGEWRPESVSKVAEWTPQETHSKGTSKNNLTLGGRFVISRNFDEEGKLSSIHMFTYDVAQKAYRQWFFGADGNTLESTGKWNAAANTLTFTNEHEGITGTFTIQFVDPDTMQFSIVSKDRNGKVYLDIQGKSTRQK